MKIHIVQKGDTLWEIAKKYKVDFEELKELNSHLSSPDMIMPGMKIKIPSTKKPVKKEGHMKEKQVKATKPYKDLSPKPLPIIKEDDKEKSKAVKPAMPKMPEKPKMPQQQPIMQMPMIEQDMTQYTTIHMPAPKETSHTPTKKAKKETMTMPSYHQPIHHHPMPMMPMCCHVVHPCCPPLPIGHYHTYDQPVMMPQAMPFSPCEKGYRMKEQMPTQVIPWEKQAQAGMYPHHLTSYPKPPSMKGAKNEGYRTNTYPPYDATDPTHYPYPQPSSDYGYSPFNRDNQGNHEE